MNEQATLQAWFERSVRACPWTRRRCWRRKRPNVSGPFLPICRRYSATASRLICRRNCSCRPRISGGGRREYRRRNHGPGAGRTAADNDRTGRNRLSSKSRDTSADHLYVRHRCRGQAHRPDRDSRPDPGGAESDVDGCDVARALCADVGHGPRRRRQGGDLSALSCLSGRGRRPTRDRRGARLAAVRASGDRDQRAIGPDGRCG